LNEGAIMNNTISVWVTNYGTVEIPTSVTDEAKRLSPTIPISRLHHDRRTKGWLYLEQWAMKEEGKLARQFQQ